MNGDHNGSRYLRSISGNGPGASKSKPLLFIVNVGLWLPGPETNQLTAEVTAVRIWSTSLHESCTNTHHPKLRVTTASVSRSP